MRRWWFWPLVAAAAIDLALVARFQLSAGVAVDHAVLRTVGGGGCQQAVLVRGASEDNLFVIDTWQAPDGQAVSVPASVVFRPGAGLTPQSRAIIEAGREVDLQFLRRPQRPLVASYLGQLGQAVSWLQGECVPFANPFQSHLRRLGTLAASGERYTVYRGEEQYARGAFQLFATAVVWIGVRPDGRMGFEVLRQLMTRGANPAVQVVATLFQYPRRHLDAAFVHQAAPAREDFYQTEYDAVLATLGRLDAEGFPAAR